MSRYNKSYAQTLTLNFNALPGYVSASSTTSCDFQRVGDQVQVLMRTYTYNAGLNFIANITTSTIPSSYIPLTGQYVVGQIYNQNNKTLCSVYISAIGNIQITTMYPTVVMAGFIGIPDMSFSYLVS